MAFPLPLVGKVRNEKTLSCKSPFQPLFQASKEPLALTTHAGLHLDSGAHVHHCPGFCLDGLSRVKFDFYYLQVIAYDLIIRFICHFGVSFFLSDFASYFSI